MKRRLDGAWLDTSGGYVYVLAITIVSLGLGSLLSAVGIT